jgi:hypothetical protein
MSIDCSLRVKVPIWNFGNFRLFKKANKRPDRKKKSSRADRCPLKLQFEKNHKIDFPECMQYFLTYSTR